MIYSFRCDGGHTFDLVRRVEHRNRRARCKCGKWAKRDRLSEIATGRHGVIPDIAEHWNLSIDAPVRSRAHLREIQRQRGLSDYDPKSHDGPPSDWK